MPDDFGRVNLLPHFLDRGAREDPYHGRHGRKQHQSDDDGVDAGSAEEDKPEPTAGTLVDLRI